MPCYYTYAPQQTPQQREVEVKKVMTAIEAALARGQVKAVVDKKTGAVGFAGITDRGRLSDVCIYQRIMSHGSAFAKAALVRAEALAGRKVNQEAQVHYHSGTWHANH